MDSVLSLAAVFWNVTQRFVTYQKTAARETMGSVKVAWNYSG